MRNIIAQGTPSAVEVGGVSIPINTDFRHGIQISRALDSPLLSDAQKADAVMLHCYGANIPDDREQALIAAVEFVNRAELDSPTRGGKRKASRDRTFDWDVDQSRLIADFQREYAIDLTSPSTRMHWWRFMALVDGLSDTSQTMTAIGYRGSEVPAGAADFDKRRIKKMKQHYALPPRTTEEAARRDSAIWGD